MFSNANGRPQLHVTALSMMQGCGEQFRRRYIEGHKIPPGVRMIVGKATDISITANLSNKIATGELLDDEVVSDIARDALNREWDAEGVALDDDEAGKGIAAVRGEAVDKSIRLAVLHHEVAAPKIKPTAVQRAFAIDVPGYGIELAGTMDIQEGLDCVRDTKTSAKSPTADAAHDSDQLTMYALAGQVLDGVAPKRVALDFLVDLKTPKAVTLESTRDASDFSVLLSRVENAAMAIQKGVFVPARQDDWRCSQKWCGYWHSCRYARRPKTVAISGSNGE